MFGEARDMETEEGRLLEDDDIFESPTPGEEPVLRDDVKIIASIESDIHAIQYLLTDIYIQKGMSQAIALEAAEYSEDIKKIPLAYFTKDPTKTQLQVAQESLIDSIRKGIRRIYEIIKEWIRRFITWATGIFKKNPTQKDYDQAVRKIELQEEKARDAWEAVIDQMSVAIDRNTVLDENKVFLGGLLPPTELPDVNRVVLEILERRPSIYINKILKTTDPLIYSMVYMGEYVQLVQKVSSYLPILMTQLNVRLKKLEESYDAEQAEPLDEYQRRVRLKVLDDANKDVVVSVDNKPYTLPNLISTLSKLHNSTISSPNTEKISYTDLCTRLYSNINALNVTQFINHVYKALRNLAKIEERINFLQAIDVNLEYGEHWNKGNDEFVSRFREALAKLGADINHATIVIRYVKIVADQYYYMSRDVSHFSDTVLDWLITEGRKKGLTVPNEIAEYVIKMNKRRNHNYSKFKGYTDPR